MGFRAPRKDVDESDLAVGAEAHAAAGPTAVAVAMARSIEQMGPLRTARTLLRLNQVDGFDCMGCAWPDPEPGHRHTAEFCENGAKAVAEEATLRRVEPDFFARHSLAELDTKTDYWLGQQGRITHPMVKRDGATHYEPISWEDAFALIGSTLRELASPDEAVFYTSGKTSNEAAFAYQLFVRAFGTNNLPDCSNMCHESTSVALAETIGIGKGSVSLADVETAQVIVVAGQNPGTNHPRMLSALEKAKRAGATIVAINPLREPGLVRFKNPQKVRGVVGSGTALADLYLQVRLNGDLALFQGLAAYLLERGAIDRAFIDAHTVGYDAWAEHVRAVDWAEIERASGVSRAQIEEFGAIIAESSATVYCWAMGITQHRNSVAIIKEIVNVALMRGDIGKPGAGLCPVRGHSNVQGDRTMGIWERPSEVFLDRLQAEFGFEPPREHGFDAVEAVRALDEGRARFFFGMGGNFVSAISDTEVAERAMRRADLTVHVSTKLNRSHVVAGRQALILPALGRTEKDLTGGREQRVTVEDSMSAVHASKGPLKPASPHLRSEVDIVCSMAEAAIGTRHAIDWGGFRDDYTAIRRHIGRVVPGAERYDELVDQPGGFVLPHPPRDSRTFETAVGKAVFSVSPLEVLEVPEGRLVLQTMRSHDQFNTTIYGLDDRYRGIKNARRVVLVHPEDVEALGFAVGDIVDLISEWHDGSQRCAPDFRIVAYEQPRGCAAAYYPETNPLVPLDSKAEGSNTPTSKSVIVRLEAAAGRRAGLLAEAGAGAEDGADRDKRPIASAHPS
ncbi:FdhF/YdeP family oxidoreductase [Nocardioides sp. R-C-SC26]|uniref:FdhF/YdeP family oxidoreductase n=1 Tax=Nocardioides sp. R-C-SC26 TaxID=2870414 RepID=UPI001E442826|nr:FdhF/YdeP family oxidoreductase [Nocardioides sp. R-C-SC26]